MSVVEVLGGKRKQGRGPYGPRPFLQRGKTVRIERKAPTEGSFASISARGIRRWAAARKGHPACLESAATCASARLQLQPRFRPESSTQVPCEDRLPQKRCRPWPKTHPDARS